jgi:hypothetical protein
MAPVRAIFLTMILPKEMRLFQSTGARHPVVNGPVGDTHQLVQQPVPAQRCTPHGVQHPGLCGRGWLRVVCRRRLRKQGISLHGPIKLSADGFGWRRFNHLAHPFSDCPQISLYYIVSNQHIFIMCLPFHISLQ